LWATFLIKVKPMNINPSSHSHIESHTITNCIHEHHSVQKGGISFQSEMQQSVKAQPQTVEEALHELAAINREINTGHKIFGTGNTLGNVISDVIGEGSESVVIPMADNSANANSNSTANLQVTAEMLNQITMPRKDSLQKTKSTLSNITNSGVSSSDTTAGSQLQEKKKGYIPFHTKGIKKRISKWIQAFPEKFKHSEKVNITKGKEMKPLTQEYILDTYDKKGQYHQLEKRGTITDNLNEKA